jgi:hypothetical protein
MSDHNLAIPDCDGALFNENVSRFPSGELLKYAGRYVAWSLDGARILASGKDHDELDRNLAAAGLRQGSFVEDYVPGPDEHTVLQ